MAAVVLSAIAGFPASAQQGASPRAVPTSESSAPTPPLDLTPGANGALSQEQMQQLFRVVAEKDDENNKKLRDYTYIEREVETKLDGKGDAKSTETTTYDVLEINGEQVQRLIAKGDKPLDAKEAAKEEEKIQKIIDKRKGESDGDRKKREERDEKNREEGHKFVHEVADAYNFKLVGMENLGGREAWVIDGEPRPGFEPHLRESKFLSKFRGRVWIDKGDLQLAKMDVECIDTVSLGLFLARVHKGTRVTLQQTRVNDEVWLPQQLSVKIDVRLALFKEIRVGEEQTFSEYKKFRASSRVVSVGHAEENK
jgi:hypothetical protein